MPRRKINVDRLKLVFIIKLQSYCRYSVRWVIFAVYIYVCKSLKSCFPHDHQVACPIDIKSIFFSLQETLLSLCILA